MSTNASNTSGLVCCHKRTFNSLQPHHFCNIVSNVGEARGTFNIFCIILVISAPCSILTLKFEEEKIPNCLNKYIINYLAITFCIYSALNYYKVIQCCSCLLYDFYFFFTFSRLPKKSCSAFLQLLHKLIQAMLGVKQAQAKKKKGHIKETQYWWKNIETCREKKKKKNKSKVIWHLCDSTCRIYLKNNNGQRFK